MWAVTPSVSDRWDPQGCGGNRDPLVSDRYARWW